MKIIVFGGSGFLGSYVADELSTRGHKVTIADNKKSKWISKGQKFIKINILNLNQLNKLIDGYDVVYNFAAIADIGEAYKKPIQTVKTNILGTVNMLEACRKNKVKRYVFASSIYVFSNQGGFYRSSKQSAELYIEEYSKLFGLKYTILRFGSIYGPRSGITNGLFKIVFDALNLGIATYRGTPKAVRSYIHARDTARISVDILKKKFINKKVLVTGNRVIKIKQLLVKLSKILKISEKPKFLNQTEKGHYNISPYSYKPRPTIKFSYKKCTKLDKGVLELIKEINKKKRVL